MNHFVIALSLALFAALPALAQDEQRVPVEHLNKKGLIKPTSNGSSGAPSGTPAGASDGGDEGTIGGNGQTQSDSGSFGVSGGGSGTSNPYPNAVSQTGQVTGGSVTGTGALNSAHPGQ